MRIVLLLLPHYYYSYYFYYNCNYWDLSIFLTICCELCDNINHMYSSRYN
jgi:hypothetical protein